MKINTVCDACACGHDITKCKKDIKSTITDGCGRAITYCSRYTEINLDE
jgi:hypothetical protein